VQKAVEYAQANPELVPNYLDVPEMVADLGAVTTLTGFRRPREQILEGLEDSVMAAGAEVYGAFLTYYQAVTGRGPGARPRY